MSKLDVTLTTLASTVAILGGIARAQPLAGDDAAPPRVADTPVATTAPAPPATSSTPPDPATAARPPATDTKAAVLDEADPDTEELSATPSKLQIYGFTDMTVRRVWMGNDNSVYRTYGSPEAAFAMGRINLYFRADPTPRLSSLLEVRLLYLPHNAPTVTNTGGVTNQSTLVSDDVEFGGTVQWGGISIQRAHLDYKLTDRISLRAGHWLTPYGIWNVDHGSPTVIAVRRPFAINLALFPESQIGLQAFGTRPIGDHELAWTATVSNGRLESRADHDLDKAIGGRLELSLKWLDELRVGASAYLGSDRVASFQAVANDPADPSTAELRRTRQSSATELALGADFRIRAGRLRVLGEMFVHQRRFDGARPAATAPRLIGLEPDTREFGGYVVAGFQTTRYAAMPFVQVEQMAGTRLDTSVVLGSVGLNLRPVPTLTLKVDVGYGRMSNYGAALLPSSYLAIAEAQVAWVFR